MCVCISAGKSPSQEFTAVIQAVTPLQSQQQPIFKLIHAVTKSKFCAQVRRWQETINKILSTLQVCIMLDVIHRIVFLEVTLSQYWSEFLL